MLNNFFSENRAFYEVRDRLQMTT